MVNYDDLPQFLKDRFDAMSEEVRNALLHTVDQTWVDCQIVSHELTQGVKDGRWTWEDVRIEWMKRRI
jgi:hypothetical protein